tara:strand:- start:371 stop:589 length:219 start_codon:yes stop_codon:yes gene_type:complete
MEDVFQIIETPETSTMRINADAMNHIGTMFIKTDDIELRKELFKMIQEHSKFVLETSQKIVMNRKLNIKQVK